MDRVQFTIASVFLALWVVTSRLQHEGHWARWAWRPIKDSKFHDLVNVIYLSDRRPTVVTI